MHPPCAARWKKRLKDFLNDTEDVSAQPATTRNLSEDCRAWLQVRWGLRPLDLALTVPTEAVSLGRV